MKYGYARVSTAGQAANGNSLEAQEEQLRAAGAEKIFKDAFTGTLSHRPELDQLMAVLRPGDVIIVTKLDRIARSMIQGSQLINRLLAQGIAIHILNIGMMDNTPASKLIRNIFFSFAEFERDMIVERTQEGKAKARLRDDFREGRPKKFSREQMDHALSLLATNSYKQVEAMTGISKSTLKRARKAAQERAHE